MITLDEFIEVKRGNIEDAKVDWGVDTIVNAACPNLMGGSGSCVDAAIHKKIDDINGKTGYLKQQILGLEELTEWKEEYEKVVRCKRGSVVRTEGYGLCETLIHTVGPQNDDDGNWPNTCSSSAVNTLKSCYREIVRLAFYDSNIKYVAVPVISSGNYGFDFDLAFRIGISEIYNTMLEIKRKDSEALEYSALKKIYFVIPEQDNFNEAKNILKQYKRTFKKEKRVVARKSFESQLQLLKQIQLYDSQNGYFTITKFLRYGLVWLRTFLFPVNYLKDLRGKENWEARRAFVEGFTISKVVFAVMLLWVMYSDALKIPLSLLGGIAAYSLLDTISYLLALIVLADIQNPSANIIRSLFMLAINYVESGILIAAIGFVWLENPVPIAELLIYGLTNINLSAGDSVIESVNNAWFLCLNGGIKFFFVTLVFGYFANHLKERKFRTEIEDIQKGEA